MQDPLRLNLLCILIDIYKENQINNMFYQILYQILYSLFRENDIIGEANSCKL